MNASAGARRGPRGPTLRAPRGNESGAGVSGSVRTSPLPPLPYRAPPPQVLLGVGAVLLVCSAAAVVSAHGGLVVRGLLVGLAALAAWFSVGAGRGRLRGSQEALAACGASLAVAAISAGGLSLDGDPVSALSLAIVFLLLHRRARATAAW